MVWKVSFKTKKANMKATQEIKWNFIFVINTNGKLHAPLVNRFTITMNLIRQIEYFLCFSRPTTLGVNKSLPRSFLDWLKWKIWTQQTQQGMIFFDVQKICNCRETLINSTKIAVSIPFNNTLPTTEWPLILQEYLHYSTTQGVLVRMDSMEMINED